MNANATSPGSTQAASTSQGSAYNSGEDWHFWPKDEDGTPVPPGEDGSDSLEDIDTGTTKWDWVAHRYLKKRRPLYDPIELEENGEEVELEDHEAWAPMAGDGSATGERWDTVRKFLVNAETGAMPSGPIIGDAPTDVLKRDVWAILEGAVTMDGKRGISYETAYEVWEIAMQMKSEGEAHDQTIIAEVAELVDNPRLLEFYD